MTSTCAGGDLEVTKTRPSGDLEVTWKVTSNVTQQVTKDSLESDANTGGYATGVSGFNDGVLTPGSPPPIVRLVRLVRVVLLVTLVPVVDRPKSKAKSKATANSLLF